MRFKKTISALLAVAMMATVAGCSSDKSWAASLGDVKLSAGVYSLSIMTALSEASYASGVEIAPDVNEVFAADIDGKTGSQYIIDYAQNESRRQLATDSKFTSMGLTLTEEETASFTDYGKQMYASDPDMFKAIGVSEQSVIDYNRYSYQAFKLFTTIYGEGGEKAATSEEMVKNFADNYYIAYIVPFLKIEQSTGAPLDETGIAKAKAEAQLAMDEISAGKNIADVVYEVGNAQLPEGTEVQERGKDSDYMMVVDKANLGTFPVAATDYLATAAVGKTELVEDDQFFMVIQKQDEKLVDPELAAYYYSQMLPQLKNDEYLALCLEWADELGITFNEDAVKHYTGEKVKKDTDAYIKKIQAASSASSSVANAPTLSVPEISTSSESAAPESSSSTAG